MFDSDESVCEQMDPLLSYDVCTLVMNHIEQQSELPFGVLCLIQCMSHHNHGKGMTLFNKAIYDDSTTTKLVFHYENEIHAHYVVNSKKLYAKFNK